MGEASAGMSLHCLKEDFPEVLGVLVELLPEAIQQQVREGKIGAQVAMKFLVPVARQSLEDCQRMAAIFAQRHWDTREAGQLYAAWRQGSRAARQRLLAEPELFLKTQRQPPLATPPAVEQLQRDLEMAIAILRRAGRRLPEAMTEMNGPQQEHAQRQMESARRELVRMAASSRGSILASHLQR